MISVKEIQIPVPWGVVACKAWGDETNKLIVALHGLQDNANSFDHLIPLLPNSFYYMCIDLPCHGKSSKLITESLPSFIDFILTVKIVLDYLQRKKCILIGHSFGSKIAGLYTQMYPERVEKLICLDPVCRLPKDPTGFFINYLKNVFDDYSKFHKLSTDTAPTYSYADALQKIKQGRFGNTGNEATAVLISRAVEPVGNDKFKFTTSQQLKYIFYPLLSVQYIIDVIKANPITCPNLIIMASASVPFYTKANEIINTLQITNKRFEMCTIKGDHDVHMKDPEQVANHINNFLIKHTHKL